MSKSVSHAVSTREPYITPRATGPRGDIGRGLIRHVIQILTCNVHYIIYYIMIIFKQCYWLSCCHVTFRKILYCLIKTRIDLVSLSFSNEIDKKNHVNSISIRPMDIKVMGNFVQSESSYYRYFRMNK
jgi:hypothetical protein